MERKYHVYTLRLVALLWLLFSIWFFTDNFNSALSHISAPPSSDAYGQALSGLFFKISTFLLALALIGIISSLGLFFQKYWAYYSELLVVLAWIFAWIALSLILNTDRISHLIGLFAVLNMFYLLVEKKFILNKN